MRVSCYKVSIPIPWQSLNDEDGGHVPDVHGGLFFLVGYVEERPWWLIQSPNKRRQKKARGG